MHRNRLLIAGSGLLLATGLTGASVGAAAASAATRPATKAAASAVFGSACSAVPKSGAGSFSGMTKAPVGTAASNNPVLSTLVTALKKAGLVDTLNNAAGLTVLAPDNSAFAKVPSATLKRLLANKTALTATLEYHVIAGRLSPSKLAGTHKTLEGATVKVTGSGTHFSVNGGAVVACGNVQTANATVYIISSVLSPPKA